MGARKKLYAMINYEIEIDIGGLDDPELIPEFSENMFPVEDITELFEHAARQISLYANEAGDSSYFVEGIGSMVYSKSLIGVDLECY